MGYYTRFNIQIVGDASGPIQPESIKFYPGPYARLQAISGYSDFGDDRMWSNWESDMRDLSREFPGFRFVVRGVGEEDDDEWQAYVKAGRCIIRRREAWNPPGWVDPTE